MTLLKRLFVSLTIALFCVGSILAPTCAADLEHSRKIVMFNQDVAWGDINGYMQQWEALGALKIMDLPLINAIVMRVPAGITNSDLAGDPKVKAVEDDQKLKLKGTVKGQYASFIRPVTLEDQAAYPWGILSLFDQDYDPSVPFDVYDPEDLSEVTGLALGMMRENPIRVAVFDTGIQYDHSNLSGVVKGGLDLVRTDVRGIGIEGVPYDDNGHGTHVAGIISAALDRNGKWGKNCKSELYCVKILDEYAMGDLSNIIMGLQWAIDNDMDIVNLSIGYRRSSGAIHYAIRQAYEAGLVMVASVGNLSNWDDSVILAADGGAADGGAADGGAADGGAADGGAADGGAADGGAADGGAADGGAADGGAADGGAADGGAADGGAADGGAADGGAADGGAADGGAADGGAADGGAADGGAADGGAANGWAADRGGLNGHRYGSLPLYSVMYPARYPEVIAVGASDSDGELAPYSNTGEKMDVMAPGSDIISARATDDNPKDKLGICSGTSQAAPHVTAAAAMMLALNPKLGPEDIKNIIVETSTFAGFDAAGGLDLTEALETASQTEKEGEDMAEVVLKRKSLKEKIRKNGVDLWSNGRD